MRAGLQFVWYKQIRGHAVTFSAAFSWAETGLNSLAICGTVLSHVLTLNETSGALPLASRHWPLHRTVMGLRS